MYGLASLVCLVTPVTPATCQSDRFCMICCKHKGQVTTLIDTSCVVKLGFSWLLSVSCAASDFRLNTRPEGADRRRCCRSDILYTFVEALRPLGKYFFLDLSFLLNYFYFNNLKVTIDIFVPLQVSIVIKETIKFQPVSLHIKKRIDQ